MDDDNSISASKKRKHNCHEHDDHGIIAIDEEEDNEEEKMEKFFALVQNIREARNHLLSGSNAKKKLEIGETTRFNKRKLDDQVGVWKPTFRLEDFLEDTLDHHQLMMMKSNPPKSNHVTAAAATSSLTQTKPKATGKDEGDQEAAVLDLSLSL